MNSESAEGSWFGHPKGLTFLFLTEMWERFSFYGMRALQVYYMTKQLHFTAAQASLVYGGYAAAVYLTPIFGAQISDRWLGRRRAVTIGALLMALGHFMMASEPLFYAALVMIALGNGLFLPNLPSQIGDLYAKDDPRRVSSFNVYYVGVNLGGFLAPLVCGTLGELYGWHYGFGAAGIGMCIGLVVYLSGRKYLAPEPLSSAPAEASLTPNPDGMKSVPVLLAIGLAVVLFRSAYEQSGNTLALWADTGVNRAAFGLEIPVTWFQSLNPMFVFMLTPLVVSIWNRRAARGQDLAPIRKMALGAFGVALSYGLLALISQGSGQAGWLWLVLFFLLYTAAELYILPVGLGLFARMAPARFGATTIAAWFLASFAGNLLSGVIGAWWDSVTPPVFFAGMGAIALLSALLLLMLDRPARRLEPQPGRLQEATTLSH